LAWKYLQTVAAAAAELPFLVPHNTQHSEVAMDGHQLVCYNKITKKTKQKWTVCLHPVPA